MARAEARYIITALDRTRAAFNSVGKGLRRIGSIVGSLRVQLVALTTALAGAFVASNFVQNTLKGAEAVAELNRQTGVTAKELQRVENVFQRLGMADKFRDTVLDIQEALQEAQTEPGGTKDQAFRRLGLDPNDFKEAGTKLFNALDKAFQRTGDLFSVREISTEAGDVIAALGGRFEKELRAVRKIPVLDKQELNDAVEVMKEVRTIVDGIGTALSKMFLNSQEFQLFADAAKDMRKALQMGDHVAVMERMIVFFGEAFPRTLVAARDAFDAGNRLIEFFTNAGEQLNRANAAVTGAGEATNATIRNSAQSFFNIFGFDKLLNLNVAIEKNTRQQGAARAG